MSTSSMLWEKLPQESAKAYAAFMEYRDQGVRRSLRVTAERLLGFYAGDSPGIHRVAGKDRVEERPLTTSEKKRADSTERQVERWSSAHRWGQRVAAFDLEEDRRRRERLRERAEEALDRALRGCTLVQQLALKAMVELNNRPTPEVSPPINALRWWEAGTKLELALLGVPTERTAQEVTGEIATPEDLEHAEKIAMLNEAAAKLRRA